MGLKRAPYFVLFTTVLIWCSLLFAPPLLSALEAPTLSHVAYRFFSRICHQYDARSLHVLGYPLAVCARCSAIYFGFLGGMLVAALCPTRERRRFTLWLLLVLLPVLIDVVLDGTGVHASNVFTRISTGLIFGIGSGVALAPLFAEVLDLFLSKITLRSNFVKFSQERENAEAG